MPDPATITLASVGGVVIAEGIKFLYAQAAELLKRLRERASQAAKTQAPAELVAVQVEPPASFESQPFVAKVPFAEIQNQKLRIEGLLKELSAIANGYGDVDVSDRSTLEHVIALRQVLEGLYRHPLTFASEQRSQAPVVHAEFRGEDVEGQLTVLRAQSVEAGHLAAEADIKRIAKDGSVTVVDLGSVKKSP